jgi:predicted nucleic acid-binding protein
MSRVYLDASAIIYFVEAESPFHAAAVESVGRFRNDPESRLVTSRLSRLECRVKPVRDSNKELLSKYDAFFKRRRLVIADITAAVIDRADE